MLIKQNLNEISLNPFTLIGEEWTLITAGNLSSFNTMTASWGGLGFMWGSPCATIYVRPQRFTKEFIDKNDTFSLSFFDQKYKKALSFCGSHSGRDVNKVQETNLTPIDYKGTVSFEEAKLILVCKKEYSQNMQKSSFLNDELLYKWYKDNDFHTMYMGKIIEIYS